MLEHIRRVKQILTLSKKNLSPKQAVEAYLQEPTTGLGANPDEFSLCPQILFL
jgi:hypothetical protein